MAERINLLQVVNGLAIGGAEKKLLELVKHLDKKRYSIIVCSIGQGGPLQKDFEVLDIDVVVCHKRNKFDLSLINKVAHLIRECEIDIVQTTLLLADIVGAFAARWSGRRPPVVSWETVSHGENDILRTKRRHVWAYKAAMKRVDRIVAVSQEIQYSLIERRHIAPEKIELIPYGVDLRKYTRRNGTFDKRGELKIGGDRVVIGTVARVEPYKGVAYLQQAAVQLVRQHPKIDFLFVGDGSLRKELESEVRALGLAHRIRFLGFRNDVHEIMNVFDIFVLPSLSEGLPNVILEAMASCKPVIASAVGGIPEAIVEGETGLLVPPGDSEAIVAAIKKLLGHNAIALRMGEAGRRRVEQFFSLQREVASFDRLYQKLLSEKRGA
jgi:glycosyltransferase involved in cell wall biosynthesis